MSSGNDSGLAKLFLIIFTILALFLGWALYTLAAGTPLWLQLIFALSPVILLWINVLRD